MGSDGGQTFVSLSFRIAHYACKLGVRLALISLLCDFISKRRKLGSWGRRGGKKIIFTLSSGLRSSLSANVGTRAELESVIAGVAAANLMGSDAATLVASVGATVNKDPVTIFNIDGSTISWGVRTTSVGTMASVNVVGDVIAETEDFDRLENSLSFRVGVAVVRDASKGTIEVSFMLKELRC